MEKVIDVSMGISKTLLTELRRMPNIILKLVNAPNFDLEKLYGIFLKNESIEAFRSRKLNNGVVLIEGQYKGIPFRMKQIPEESVDIGFRTYKADVKFEIVPLLLEALSNFDVVVAYDNSFEEFSSKFLFAEESKISIERDKIEQKIKMVESPGSYYLDGFNSDVNYENVYFTEDIPLDGNSPKREKLGFLSPLLKDEKTEQEGVQIVTYPQVQIAKGTFHFPITKSKPNVDCEKDPYRKPKSRTLPKYKKNM